LSNAHAYRLPPGVLQIQISDVFEIRNLHCGILCQKSQDLIAHTTENVHTRNSRYMRALQLFLLFALILANFYMIMQMFQLIQMLLDKNMNVMLQPFRQS